MRFKLHTLVDITETGARRGDDNTMLKKQQNFLTVLQTIGLRVNPSYNKSPQVDSVIPNSLGLGSTYKTKHAVWTFDFEIEHEDALSISMLVNDFNMIPIISNLDETVKFDLSAFVTQDPNINNIVFTINDK